MHSQYILKKMQEVSTNIRGWYSGADISFRDWNRRSLKVSCGKEELCSSTVIYKRVE